MNQKFFSEIEINLENLNHYFSKDEKTINVGFVENLDKLPFPNWEEYNKINKLKNNFKFRCEGSYTYSSYKRLSLFLL